MNSLSEENIDTESNDYFDELSIIHIMTLIEDNIDKKFKKNIII